VEADVESSAENAEPVRTRVRLLGTLRVERAGCALPLPPSRKVRALLGYLALAPRPVTRARLCELLWDVANDPRGELRWCLAKLRPLLDTPGQPGLIADRERIGIDTSVVEVDALSLAHAAAALPAVGITASLKPLIGMIDGELLEGLTLERSPAFDAWLAAERQRFTRLHVKALRCLAQSLPPDSEELVDMLRRRCTLVPYDAQAHIELIAALLAQGRKAEAEVLRASAVRLFQREGLDATRLRHASAAPPARGCESGAPISSAGVAPARATTPDSRGAAQQRPSVVVLPFAAACAADQELADSLTYDIIFGLAKLRSLMVIARGTAFAMPRRASGPADAADLLGVGYAASATLARHGEQLQARVELIAAARGRIVWVEDFAAPADEAFTLPGTLAARIISGIDAEIHLAERNRALLQSPSSLDAWQAYHRGLWHMYRFNAVDNDAAQHFFTQAIARDPAFSRSHAGLSFTHFQNAFLLRSQERARETAHALESAGRALLADSRDPAAHWAMGRALWLRGENDAAIRALDEAVDLSPNFALGHYTRAFVHAQSGDPTTAIAAAETSQQLSPFDPMIFAIQASKVFGLLRLDHRAEAGELARDVLRQPNVHVHARAIAALALGFVGHHDEARAALATIRDQRPDYDLAQFLAAFRLTRDLETLYREGARRVGL
jgi:DNA-binding SARP family transcriptional activator/TolB-like protein